MLEHSVGFRPVIVVATILCALGIFLSAIATRMLFLYLTLGLLYGSSSGICFHATICVLLQHFPLKNTRPTAVLLLGSTVGVLVYSQLLEITLTSFGWRISMLILASLIIIPGLPASFLITPVSRYPRTNHAHEEHITKTMGRRFSQTVLSLVKKKEARDSCRKIDASRLANYSSSVEKGTSLEIESLDEYTPWREWSSSDLSSSSTDDRSSNIHSTATKDKPKEVKSRKRSLTTHSWCGDCKVVMKMGQMWIFAVACVLSAMAWCVFIINIGSFFDSVGLTLSETAFLLTIMATMEIAGKLYLATIGESVPVAKIHFLIGQSVIMTSVSVILIFAENYIAMIFLSIVIGFMRALWMTLPYTVSVEIFGPSLADQSVTVTLFCQGLGNLIGNLPAGLIYDATGSYQLVFTMVATCTLIASALYSLLPFLRQSCNHPLPCRNKSDQFQVVPSSLSVDIIVQTDVKEMDAVLSDV
ncbi:monocarboxylate transporter 9-like isoform X2 [Apostichopus japonicus]